LALETEARFERAQDAWPEYQELASDVDKKRLYGLYKFVLEGAASPARAPPSGSKDPILKWKWEAWSSVAHTTEVEAKREYADLVFAIGARGSAQGGQDKGEGGKTGPDAAAAASAAAAAAASAVSSTTPTPAPTPAAATPTAAPLPERFEGATQYIKNNGQNLGLGTEKLLMLYAFFKQAKKGDNKDARPSMWSGPAKVAKWDAYEECKGMSQELAMQKYIDEVTKIDKDWEGGVPSSSSSSSSSSSKSSSGGGGGMGMNVSTMSSGQHSNDGTTSLDWEAHVSELHAAASSGDRAKVRVLLGQNNTAKMVNSTDDVGMTALMYACDGAHEGVVEELLTATGIDLALKESQDGMTALHYAMCTKRIAGALIAAGADVNATDNDGTTCLSMCDDKDQGEDRITRAEVAEALAK
jgi:diazepam-binding inhibitor (GABA receptor modulating acyl-CoA-binding protein)